MFVWSQPLQVETYKTGLFSGSWRLRRNVPLSLISPFSIRFTDWNTLRLFSSTFCKPTDNLTTRKSPSPHFLFPLFLSFPLSFFFAARYRFCACLQYLRTLSGCFPPLGLPRLRFFLIDKYPAFSRRPINKSILCG